MKKVKKFNLEKFQVAKLKNMKKVKGGNGTGNIDDNQFPTLTVSVQGGKYSEKC